MDEKITIFLFKIERLRYNKFRFFSFMFNEPLFECAVNEYIIGLWALCE
ncbi:hypothetical protein B14911_10462 [Bacillus sp. NRRL B-14911]|nr:hypothetical protein B14911_10462 [Bacillus sp. NRRL B-14911]